VGELVSLVQVLIQVLIFAIFARAIVTWFPIDRNGPIVRTLDAITEPVLQPLRRVIPLIGMVDITPMVAILLLVFIQQALASGAI
jgi:YggT family protein